MESLTKVLILSSQLAEKPDSICGDLLRKLCALMEGNLQQQSKGKFLPT